uniref:WSC domain-containing protein n=1 Tax=Cryptococcus bacillisporus CA1280 TaxID=1296109 RepID=A0A0D0VKA6_CRYGA|nr:hypothetical protein I312_05406 [Cryptococcus bacillisporus CA1280]
MPCAADNFAICGGGNAVQLYVNPSLAQDLTIVDNYYHQGCVKEVTGRLLATNSLAYSGMTLEMCISFCANQGLPLCYRSAGSLNNADSLTLSTQCNMPCGGNSSENCGGPDAIQLYVSESFTGSLGWNNVAA